MLPRRTSSSSTSIAIALAMGAYACAIGCRERPAPPAPPVQTISLSPGFDAGSGASYVKNEYEIPMRDGAKLFTSIYTPADCDQRNAPILLVRTNAALEPYGSDAFPSMLGPSRELAHAGYIFVWQEVRGTHRSSGDPQSPPFESTRLALEVADTEDTIDWLFKKLVCNSGRIGIWGEGISGYYALAAARVSRPELRAVVARSPVTDGWFDDDLHRGGALLGAAGSASGVSEHPDYDKYWIARQLTPTLRGVHAAVLVVAGWSELDRPGASINAYRAIEAQNPTIRNTLLIGGWTHTEDPDPLHVAEVAFFERWLRDAPDPGLPEAYVFDTGTPRWYRFKHWPPREAHELTLYLAPGHRIARAPASAASSYDQLTSDPTHPVPDREHEGDRADCGDDQRFTDGRLDVLRYATDILDHDWTVAGPIDIDLTVSTTGTDADWIAKLVDISPDGARRLVRTAVLRGREREAPALPFKPGEITRVTLQSADVLHTFARGHRLGLQLQSTLAPTISPNPQTCFPQFAAPIPSLPEIATEKIYQGGDTASSIRISVIPALDEPAAP